MKDQAKTKAKLIEELERRSHVNARANAAYDAPDFSRQIRMPIKDAGAT